MAYAAWWPDAVDSGSCGNLNSNQRYHCSRYICFCRGKGDFLRLLMPSCSSPLYWSSSWYKIFLGLPFPVNEWGRRTMFNSVFCVYPQSWFPMKNNILLGIINILFLHFAFRVYYTCLHVYVSCLGVILETFSKNKNKREKNENKEGIILETKR